MLLPPPRRHQQPTTANLEAIRSCEEEEEDIRWRRGTGRRGVIREAGEVDGTEGGEEEGEEEEEEGVGMGMEGIEVREGVEKGSRKELELVGVRSTREEEVNRERGILEEWEEHRGDEEEECRLLGGGEAGGEVLPWTRELGAGGMIQEEEEEETRANDVLPRLQQLQPQLPSPPSRPLPPTQLSPPSNNLRILPRPKLIDQEATPEASPLEEDLSILFLLDRLLRPPPLRCRG